MYNGSETVINGSFESLQMTFFIVVQEFANHNVGPLLRREHEMTVHIPLRA
jgi:hypothetical protein